MSPYLGVVDISEAEIIAPTWTLHTLSCDTSKSVMQPQPTAAPEQEPTLVGIDTCLKLVFPDEASRPGRRTFLEWKSRKYFPSLKIGKRVFLDPVLVRKALEKRFTIEAID